MKVISVSIQKGGSGKTTTTVNTAAALRELGHRVLLVDLDPQANLTQALGYVDEPEENIYELINKQAAGDSYPINNYIFDAEDLHLIPASLDLANSELELVSVYGREKILSDILKKLKNSYDFVFIDCPPSIGMLTVNALNASDYVLIPLQAEFLPLKGVMSFMKTFKRIKSQLNRNLKLLGIVLTKYDKRKTMNREVYEQLMEEFEQEVFETRIRSNIALAKAQAAGVDIYNYAPSSNGAKDYLALAKEVEYRLR
ncbi:MAG: AAA family ATPase [Bacteroidota bacterium]